MSDMIGIDYIFKQMAQLTPEKFRVFQVMNAAMRVYSMDSLSRFSIWYDEANGKGVYVRLYSADADSPRRLLCEFIYLKEAIDRSPNANDLARNLSMIIGAYADDAETQEKPAYPAPL